MHGNLSKRRFARVNVPTESIAGKVVACFSAINPLCPGNRFVSSACRQAILR